MNYPETQIGKDIIESLTFGMYEDARIVYREYIQNSADQIDRCVESGKYNNKLDGSIWIDIDKSKRRIVIEDNATGISAQDVLSILRNIAQSTKDRSTNKGFRGIGRLGGLAYCELLVFETTFEGEDVKSIVSWDAKLLRDIINNRLQKEEAAEVINQVTSLRVESIQPSEHYFKVILEGVNNDLLLDREEIERYLSMVAPVPFHPRFIFKDKIYEQLERNNLSIDDYKIYINNNQLVKAYTTKLYEYQGNNKVGIDDIFDIQFFNLKMPNGEVLAWGWYGLSTFTKQIPEHSNPARGIRLRKANIQVGTEYCLVKLHKEQRGNFYFFGEVHAFHSGLIPNARRDYFLENHFAREFDKQISKFFELELYKLYYEASKIRNANKRIEKFVEFRDEFESKFTIKGFDNKEQIKQFEEQFEKLKSDAEKAKKELGKIELESEDINDPKKKILHKVFKSPEIDVDRIQVPVTIDNGKPKFVTDDLSKLTKEQRKLVAKIFGVIDKVLTKDLSENLKLKIKEEFK